MGYTSQLQQNNDEENFIIFCLDSGATKHFISDKNLLHDIRKVDEFKIVNSFGVKDIGNISGKFHGQLDNGLEATLNDVLYTKKIGANLISIQELNKRGLIVVFEDDSAFIRSSDGIDLCEAKNNGTFYEIRFKKQSQAKEHMKTLFNKVDSWHNRLGLISKEYLVKMKEKELCYRMDFNKKDLLHICHGCAEGNIKRSLC